jgi:hypothetical protein
MVIIFVLYGISKSCSLFVCLSLSEEKEYSLWKKRIKNSGGAGYICLRGIKEILGFVLDRYAY